MFLSGTLLNALAVVIGTTLGVLLGDRIPERLRASLTDALGLFTVVIGISLALPLFTDPAFRPGDDLAVMGALLLGVVIGHALRITERLDALGLWFQQRLSREGRSGRV